MNKYLIRFLIIPVSLMFSGCALMDSMRTSQSTPMGGTPGLVGPQTGAPVGGGGYQVAGGPFGGQAPQDPFAPHNSVQLLHSQTMSAVSNLKERVRRVERAMIRLDRRMQLLERNELNRMGSPVPGDDQSSNAGAVFQPMQFATKPLSAPDSGYMGSVRGGFKPVAHNPQQRVTSALQPAPSGIGAVASLSGSVRKDLPSLADNQEKASEVDSDISIWTINYAPRKIWPSRDQLPGSRDVVEVLRSDRPVALFARGSRPSSKEFRERVRAVSRYLGRVSDQDNVPIASMAAEHLDGDTIEIIVTN